MLRELKASGLQCGEGIEEWKPRVMLGVLEYNSSRAIFIFKVKLFDQIKSPE